MTSKKLYNNFFLLILIIIYAFLINWFSGNRGVLPIDTFGFFDTGYSILKGKLPIRDYWIFTGLFVDYLQAFFFWLFGLSWNSYIFHASFINAIATVSFFYFLKNYNINKYLIFFYCISFATLLYPVSGTPFAYLHSFAFSLIAIFIFFIAIENESNLAWFALPFLFFISFFSMQTPSFYIIFLLTLSSGYFFFKNKKIKNFKYFTIGSLLSFFLFFLFIYLTKTPIKNLVYEYFLFPITIGEGRINNQLTAYVKLSDQLNFKRIFGDFKFIIIFFISLLITTLILIKKKYKTFLFLNIVILFAVFLFIFNQLNQANQIYIFSLIPVTASVLQINLKTFSFENNKRATIILILIVIFSSIKFHLRYNVERYFLDFKKYNNSIAIDAKKIDKKLRHLKWLSYNFDNPVDEINLINLALETLRKDQRDKILITHYQFFSLILEEDLNILNRWYLWNNNTHPTETHKYFSFYKEFVNKNYKKNKPEVIYLLGFKEKHFIKVMKYFDKKCFSNYTLVENYFYKFDFVSCKK